MLIQRGLSTFCLALRAVLSRETNADCVTSYLLVVSSSAACFCRKRHAVTVGSVRCKVNFQGTGVFTGGLELIESMLNVTTSGMMQKLTLSANVADGPLIFVLRLLVRRRLQHSSESHHGLLYLLVPSAKGVPLRLYGMLLFINGRRWIQRLLNSLAATATD